MSMSKLIVECGAVTKHGRPVALPEGTEVPITSVEAYRWAAEHPRDNYMDLMCRCPGAKNPAPYRVDVSDLLLALPR